MALAAHDHGPQDADRDLALEDASDLLKLESELARLIEDGPTLLIIQRGTSIAYANAAARRDLGKEVAAGKPPFFVSERLHVEDRDAFTDGQSAAQGGTVWLGVVRLEQAPGDFRPVHLTVFPVDFGGPALAFSARDLSLDVEEKAHLFVNSRSASAAVLAAGVAHEVNNPLATIMTNLGFVFDQLQLISDALPDAPTGVADRIRQSLDALQDTHASGMRIETIVRDLRAFVPDGEPKTSADVNEAVRAAVRRIDVEGGTPIRIVTDFGSTPFVEANSARLAQAVFNLIMNAIESIPVEETSPNEVRVTTRSLDGCAVVSVSDTGRGIPANVRTRIFDAFFTTKTQGDGMGLGLFVVHAIVASMGGRIEVDTVVRLRRARGAAPSRRGTTVTLHLPGVAEPPRSRISLK